jgi:hypothetical protein
MALFALSAFFFFLFNFFPFSFSPCRNTTGELSRRCQCSNGAPSICSSGAPACRTRAIFHVVMDDCDSNRGCTMHGEVAAKVSSCSKHRAKFGSIRAFMHLDEDGIGVPCVMESVHNWAWDSEPVCMPAPGDVIRLASWSSRIGDTPLLSTLGGGMRTTGPRHIYHLSLSRTCVSRIRLRG